MKDGIRVPMDMKKLFKTLKGLDEDSQEQTLSAIEIFICGRAIGRKSDYQAGFDAGYAKAMKDAKKIATA